MKKSSDISRVSAMLYSLALLLLLQQSSRVAAHARIECPPPLSGETGEKTGPCDVAADDGSVPSFPLKANALNTITWLESISHPGAPVRFALSREGGGPFGFESCILLDHIPHDALSRPKIWDTSSYHRSSITLWIPDIQCERCYLQLISVMSDGIHGVPSDTKCAYQGALAIDDNLGHPGCPAVYHSCSPISINGSIPRNDIDVCNTTEFEDKLEWPLTPRNNPDLYEHSVYYNRGDVGLFSTTDFRLLSVGKPLTDAMCTDPIYCDPETSFEEVLKVPDAAPYTALEGACASILESTVEAWQPGGHIAALSNFESDVTPPSDGDALANGEPSPQADAGGSSSGSILSFSAIHSISSFMLLMNLLLF